MRRLALVLAGAGLLVTAAHAGTAGKLSGSGIVHRVDVIGTALAHTVQAADGSQTVTEIPATADAALDVQPTLDIDPISDQPVLVWSRDEGGGFDLFVSRFDGRDWSSPEPFAETPADDLEAQIRVRHDLVHVVWRAAMPGGEMQFMRQSLWRKSLGAAFGPELLHVPDEGADLVPPEGRDDPGPAPGRDDAFFTVELPPRDGSAGRIIVWGIRDEPVPIGYRQGLRLPQDLDDASISSSSFIGDAFVVRFVAGKAFHYQLRLESGWSEQRTIRLGDDMGTADAEQVLREMLARSAPATHP